MTEPAAWSAEKQLREQRFSFVVAGVSLLVVTLADVAAPAKLLVPVFYLVPLVALVWSRDRRLPWCFAVVVILANAAGWLWGPASVPGHVPWLGVSNCILVSAAALLAAGLVHLQMSSVLLADRRRDSLRKQYAELQEMNEQISQREEEIVRQNEELQSQSEELERQSEELRISNEELASWEKRLEQLLELSRSLTAELSREEMLHRICESLAVLSEGRPAVIFERIADALYVICHRGFGPDGPQPAVLPLEQSFSGLVMSVGQTAYVEDLEKRPELLLPAPAEGGAFRSVLASPLLVRGRCIGTIEVFSTQPRIWEQAEISMIESLAAQASVSLQGAELVDEIRRERRRFEAAFRTVPFGMAITEDPQSSDVRINPAAAALFNVAQSDNISPHGPLGERLTRYMSQHDIPLEISRHPLLRAARGEEILQEEIELLLPQRRRVALLTSAAPIYDAAGKIVGAVWAFADVTLQKSLQHELDMRRREAEEASVRKTRFLAAVSHDIRTPANAMSLMVELIRRCAADPALAHEVPKLAEDLQRNTTALIELVNDMLDLSRFDSGKVDLVESEFSLSEVVQEEVHQLMPIAAQKQISLVITPLKEDVRLRTDRVKLARVLGNLIGNALKFTEQGEVRVEAEVSALPERRLLVRVRDTGMGIDTTHLSSIFDEFWQMHNPARDRSKGSGLGLAICKRLLDVMGGQIDVSSEPGRGSVFTVVLPASCLVTTSLSNAATPAASRREPVAGQSSPLALKILLVEDHATSREGTAMLLRQEGATVVEAPDGKTALERLSGEGFEAVLVDLMLPDVDGAEIVRTIRRGRQPKLPVFVLTGDVTNKRMAEIASLEVDAVIEKPIDFQRLMERLRAVRSV